ncbi:cyclic pyranopterin monophosphate synthase subunit MoaA [Luteibacter rhizovicinus]|uniref:GTP 3',8-cyclase n=1 Tax=Luteibacter rhizovicinus TaxID=242606 RepID=A0A4R3YIM5_9GAMM|nr:GTP 3',8-cyclase MoaA [Luteibacter rhizovicinus]TCV91892.1 cyclic pyranopterin monophosphate synthase subunit MoaA [Luteibacter rhizovicinus]
MTSHLTDRHGRTKRKLRISLTDRCNFRCTYCMPEHPDWLPRSSLLERDEIVRLAGLFVDEGITQIRLTGGEPLLRRDLLECVEAIDALRARGLQRLSMTTNASRIAPKARQLVEAGIDDFNVSLDAVDPDTFRALTRREIEPVLDGIDALAAAGANVKLNAVVIRGSNEKDVVPLLEWAMARRLPLRFIEYMPLDAPGHWQRTAVVTEQEILDAIGATHRVQTQERGHDPATPYLIDGEYPLGIISTVSNPFCSTCDRLRITATGELYTCLFSPVGMPLGTRMREGVDDEALLTQLRRAVWLKDAGYASHPGPVERPLTMHAMGG